MVGVLSVLNFFSGFIKIQKNFANIFDIFGAVGTHQGLYIIRGGGLKRRKVDSGVPACIDGAVWSCKVQGWVALEFKCLLSIYSTWYF